MTKARDLSKLLSTANGKIAGANLDVSFENISDTGTQGTKVATGTTAQRGSTAGQFRFNTTVGLFEGTNGTEFKFLDVSPTITAFSANNFESSQLPQNITITGTNFSVGVTVHFVDVNGTSIVSPTVTRNSSTELVAQIPNTILSTNEPFKARVTNVSGLSVTSTLEFNIDASPIITQSSGSLGSVNDLASGTHFTLTATDDEGDNITWSETTNNLTNAGLTLNSNGTITGNVTDVVSDTVTSFTARASDGTNTSDRNFSITTTLGRNGLSSARSAIGGAEIKSLVPSSTNGTYYLDPYYTGGQLSTFDVASTGTYSNPQQYTVDMTNGGWATVNMSNLNINLFGSNLATNPPSVSGTKIFKNSQGGNINSPNVILYDEKLLGRHEFPVGYKNWDIQFDLSSVWGFASLMLITTNIQKRLNTNATRTSYNTAYDPYNLTENRINIFQNNSNNMGHIVSYYGNGSGFISDDIRTGTSMGTDTQRFKIENNQFIWYRNGSQIVTRNLSDWGSQNQKYFIYLSLQDPLGSEQCYVNFQHVKVRN